MGIKREVERWIYQKSNGKLERFYQTFKAECIRPKTPLSLEDARRIAAEYIEHYNNVRLHSAIGYIAPADKLAGRQRAGQEARRGKRAEKAEASISQRGVRVSRNR